MLVAAGAATLLTACSAGQVTQTASKVPSVPGANVQKGSIAVRNAVILFPAKGAWEPGSSVPLELAIANVGTEADRLLTVTTEAAEEVRTVGTLPSPTSSAPPGSTESISPSASASQPASPSASQSPASPTATASPSAPGGIAVGEPTPGAAPFRPIDLAPGTLTTLNSRGMQLVLVGLKGRLSPAGFAAGATAGPTASSSPSTPGSAPASTPGSEPTASAPAGAQPGGELSTRGIEVVFTFEKAGTLTMRLNVATPDSPQPRITPTYEEETDEGGHG